MNCDLSLLGKQLLFILHVSGLLLLDLPKAFDAGVSLLLKQGPLSTLPVITGLGRLTGDFTLLGKQLLLVLGVGGLLLLDLPEALDGSQRLLVPQRLLFVLSGLANLRGGAHVKN